VAGERHGFHFDLLHSNFSQLLLWILVQEDAQSTCLCGCHGGV